MVGEEPQNPQDWFPYRGTLVALLRHGQRAGALAQGRRDVVDHDVDVVVGVVSEMAWLMLRWTINMKLRHLGAADAAGKLPLFWGDPQFFWMGG